MCLHTYKYTHNLHIYALIHTHAYSCNLYRLLLTITIQTIVDHQPQIKDVLQEHHRLYMESRMKKKKKGREKRRESISVLPLLFQSYKLTLHE